MALSPSIVPLNRLAFGSAVLAEWPRFHRHAHAQRPRPVADGGPFAGMDRLVRKRLRQRPLRAPSSSSAATTRVLFEQALWPARGGAAPARDRRYDFDSRLAHQGRRHTTAVCAAVEQGRVRLNDAVATFVPGFERTARERSAFHIY